MVAGVAYYGVIPFEISEGVCGGPDDTVDCATLGLRYGAAMGAATAYKEHMAATLAAAQWNDAPDRACTVLGVFVDRFATTRALEGANRARSAIALVAIPVAAGLDLLSFGSFTLLWLVKVLLMTRPIRISLIFTTKCNRSGSPRSSRCSSSRPAAAPQNSSRHARARRA